MIDLRSRDAVILKALLRTYVPEAEVWAYGSRVKGSNHAGSDLDLVVRNIVALDVPQRGIGPLRDAIEDSNIPFLIDLHDWALIPEHFRRQITDRHVVFMPASLTPVATGPGNGDHDV